MASASEIDALFKLPQGEFTAARNALASRLKKAGRTEESQRVKGIAKPTATAWAVNQLYWQHPKDVERLIDLSEKVRKAQTSGHANLRELFDQRRKLLSELTKRAAGILRDAGHGVTPDATRRLTITLESLASWGHTDGAPQAGRLTADLEPLGFDEIAALLGGKKIQAKVLPFRAAKPAAEDPAAIREAVKNAQKALREAEREADRARAALEKATARAEAVEKQKQEIEARHAQAKEEMRAAASEAKKAAQALADAQRTLERARA